MPTKTELHQRQTQLATHYLEKLCEATTHYKNRDLETGLALFDTHWPQIHWNVTRLIERAPADQTAAALIVEYTQVGEPILKFRQHLPERIAWLKVALQRHPHETDLLILLGHAYLDTHELALATACFEAALAHTTDFPMMVEARYGLGMVAVRRGDYANAVHLLETVLPDYEATDNLERLLSVSGELGIAMGNQGNSGAARFYYERALALAEQHGDQRIIGLRLSSLAGVLQLAGDFAAAQSHFERAINLQRSLGDQYGLLASLRGLGANALALGDYPRAYDWYNAALSISHKFGARNISAELYHGLGNVAVALKSYDTASTYYQQALAFYEAIDRQVGIATLFNDMGNFYFVQGHFPAARNYYEHGASIAQAIGAFFALSHLAIGLSKVYLKLGEVESARTALAEGLRIASTDPVRVALLSSAARFWFQHGDALQAAEWLGLIVAHPATNAKIREEMEAWLPELYAVLAEDDLTAALERGAALELATVIEAILSAF